MGNRLHIKIAKINIICKGFHDSPIGTPLLLIISQANQRKWAAKKKSHVNFCKDR